jgi:hypothetical protein
MYQFATKNKRVKYRIKKNNREYNYGLIISYSMNVNFWRKNIFDQAEFGNKLQLILSYTNIFTF